MMEGTTQPFWSEDLWAQGDAQRHRAAHRGRGAWQAGARLEGGSKRMESRREVGDRT